MGGFFFCGERVNGIFWCRLAILSANAATERDRPTV
jgi:hypothetical protein